MATKVTLPLLGQTMEEGTIIKWFKKEGERVEKEEPLLEVMTDKANMEVESPESGVLLKIVAQEDETVPVKGLIAILGEPGEDISALLAEAGAEAPAAGPAGSAPAEASKPGETPAPAPSAAAAPPSGRVAASPRARRLAEEHGLDLAQLAPGSGPGGRIIEKDVLRAIESGAAAAAPAAPAATPLAAKVAEEKGVDLAAVSGSGPGGKIRREDVEAAAAPAAVPLAPRVPLGGVIPFAGLRKAVADNLEKSARAVIPVTLTMGVDMSEATRMREQLNPVYEKKHGVRLSFTDIVIKAAARAIEDYPVMNSSLEGDQIRIHDGVHVCVAVAVPDGLLAPVVRDANLKPLWAISAEVRDLAERGRAGRLGPAELSGGTFTVTNLGAFGVEHFNAIINPPQCAILAVCAIQKKPVVTPDDRIEVRPMMNLCLTFDHRIVDGAPAAEFLAHIKELLENPYLFLG